MENITATANKRNYTTIDHVARFELGLSMNEYAVADKVYHFSNNPDSSYPQWCYATKARIGEILDMSERSVLTIVGSLEDKGIIEKHPVTKHLRTTQLWYDTVVSSSEMKELHPDTEVSSSQQGEVSSSPIYEINNKEIKNKNIEIHATSLKGYSSLESLGEDDLQEIADKYHVPLSFVQLQSEKLQNYVLSTGKKYKDYKRALMAWVLRDAEKIAERRGGDFTKRAVDARNI